MTSLRISAEPEVSGSPLTAGLWLPDSPYLLRLQRRLGEIIASAPDTATASVQVLVPPGLDPAAVAARLLAAQGQVDVHAGHFPAAPAGRSSRGAKVLDYRDFCYNRDDIQYLLRLAPELCGAPGPAIAGNFDLLQLSAGWPVLTEALISAIGGAQQAPSPGQREPLVLATLAPVWDAFEAHWVPLLQASCPWLFQVALLPMLNLDLLAHLYPGAGRQLRDCRAIGLVEPCARHAGFYRIDRTLDGLLLRAARERLDVAVQERAVSWYEAQGYLAEAIECLAALGAEEDLLATLKDRQHSRHRSAPGRARRAPALGDLGPPTGVARAALGVGGRTLPASLRIAAPSRKTGSEPGELLPTAVAHILDAYRQHRRNDPAAVGAAMGAAVQSGLDREELSGLLDFIDVHVRPLAFNPQSPLAFALKDLRHSAPAREAVSAQYESLNHRELQILQRICEGYKNREISEQLGLELSTIKWYSTRIYEKLQVRNRTQAVARAQALGLFR